MRQLPAMSPRAMSKFFAAEREAFAAEMRGLYGEGWERRGQPAPAPAVTRLLIAQCGAEKGEAEDTACIDRYTGPLWQSVRTHRTAQVRVMALSAKFGLVDEETRMHRYDMRMDAARVRNMIVGGVDRDFREATYRSIANQHRNRTYCPVNEVARAASHSRTKAFADVCIVGGALYAQVAVAWVESLQAAGLIAKDARVLVITDMIGKMRQRMNAWLAEEPTTTTAPEETPVSEPEQLPATTPQAPAVPITTHADLTAALEAARPTIACSYGSHVQNTFAQMVASYGPSLRGVGSSWQFGAAWAHLVRPVLRPAVTGGHPDGPREIDEVKLTHAAWRHARATVQAWAEKIEAKMGALDHAKVEFMRGNAFRITGERAGHQVSVTQQMILNVSPRGVPFNQFPARIVIDGRAASEAEWKRLVNATTGKDA